MVAHSIPPILPTSTGIPRGLVPDAYFNRYGTPDVLPRVEPRRGPVNSFEECLAAVREEFKKQIWETFGVELSSKSCIYQKMYPSYFDSIPYPLVGAPLILLNLLGRIIGLHGNTFVNT
jgi:hypothetical protein